MSHRLTLVLRQCVFLSVLVAANCIIQPATAQDGPPLTADEIVALLSGNTIKGEGYSLYYSDDGTVHGKEGSYKDTGKWFAEGDLFCVRWSKWAQGAELCWKLRKDGNKIYREGVANTEDNVVTLYEGNVDGL